MILVVGVESARDPWVICQRTSAMLPSVSVAGELNALLVSYAFPPVGGAGVQRSVKLAKYLGAHGIRPTVLTVSNPSVPIHDTTFGKDLPADMVIVRARTLEPGYKLKQATWSTTSGAAPGVTQCIKGHVLSAAKHLLVPDPQILWLPGALNTLIQEMRLGSRPDVVFVTGPPFSQFLLAPIVRIWPGTGVVLDYRDEWITARTTYEMLNGRFASAVGAALEKAVIGAAHVVTTATHEFRDNLLQSFPALLPSKVHAITNGYDSDDFPCPLPSPPTDRFVVSYAGTIFKLTSAAGLLGAVRRLHRDTPELAKLLHLRFMGRIVDTEKVNFEGTEALGVEQLGYIPHDQVLSELGASHLVLCLLDDVPGVERIYPAKIFELMHLGRRVFCLSPDGALAKLVGKCQLGDVVPPRDEGAIARYLAGHLERFRDDRSFVPTSDSDSEHLQQYHRKNLAGKFAEAMREAVAYARG